MAAKTAKRKTSSKASPAQRAGKAMSREARAAYAEISQGVKNLERSIGEIQSGLLRAEKKIEADARLRIRDLRKEGVAQLKELRAREREITRSLKTLPGVAGDAWKDIKRSADAILAEARDTAAVVVERVRSAFR